MSHILSESLRQSKEIQRFVTNNLSLLEQMDGLIETYGSLNPESDLPLSNDDTYKLALSLRAIGQNYGSLSLLHISIAYVNKWCPITQQEEDLSHKSIDLS